MTTGTFGEHNLRSQMFVGAEIVGDQMSLRRRLALDLAKDLQPLAAAMALLARANNTSVKDVELALMVGNVRPIFVSLFMTQHTRDHHFL
jgi:hypothetical protein